MKGDKFKIKVVKCSNPILWYKDMIGETFEVIDEGGYGDNHFVFDKKYGFYTEDVEIVKEDPYEAGYSDAGVGY